MEKIALQIDCHSTESASIHRPLHNGNSWFLQNEVLVIVEAALDEVEILWKEHNSVAISE